MRRNELTAPVGRDVEREWHDSRFVCVIRVTNYVYESRTMRTWRHLWVVTLSVNGMIAGMCVIELVCMSYAP